MTPALTALLDDLREQDDDAAHALATSIRDLMREIGLSRDRIATATACSEACHELARLILEIDLAEEVAAAERFMATTTAKERRDMALADLSI